MISGDDVPWVEPGACPAPGLKARGIPRLAGDRVFGPFVFGMLLSSVGVWVYNIVAAILAFQLTGSVLMVGLVSVAQFAPQLVFAPLSGAMADRGDRRRQLVLGRLIVVVGSGGLALWIWLVGVDDLGGAWPVVLAALVVGIGFVVGGPAMSALIPSLVRTEELGPAIALSNVPNTVARAFGPAVGAVVAVSAGPAVAFGLAAAGNLVFALILVWLPVVDRAERLEGGDSSVRASLRHLRADPPLVLLLLGVAAVGVGADPAITLTPALSTGLGHGTALVGVLASAFGVGSALALVLFSTIRRLIGLERVTACGLCAFAIGTFALIVTPTSTTAVIAFGVAGSGMMLSLTSLSTQIQLRVPESMRGRVMALWGVAFLGTRPLAAAFDGAIADAVSLEAALASIGVILLAAAWASSPSRLLRVTAGP